MKRTKKGFLPIAAAIAPVASDLIEKIIARRNRKRSVKKNK